MRYFIGLLAACIALSCGRVEAQQATCPFPPPIRSITTLPYTSGNADLCALLEVNVTTTGNLALPPSGSPFALPGFYVMVKNVGNVDFTITSQTNTLTNVTATIDGQSQAVVKFGTGGTVMSDGTNWVALGFSPRLFR